MKIHVDLRFSIKSQQPRSALCARSTQCESGHNSKREKIFLRPETRRGFCAFTQLVRERIFGRPTRRHSRVWLARRFLSYVRLRATSVQRGAFVIEKLSSAKEDSESRLVTFETSFAIPSLLQHIGIRFNKLPWRCFKENTHRECVRAPSLLRSQNITFDAE